MSTMNRDKINILDKLKEIPKSILNGLNKRQAQETLGVSRPNFIVNGDHQVNQRGLLPVTGVTDGNYETTDRYSTSIGGSGVTGDAALNNGRLKFTVTAGAGGYIGCWQGLEDVASLKGKTVTVSVTIKSNNSSAKVFLYDVSSKLIGTHSGGGGDEIISGTVTVASSPASISLFIMITGSTVGSQTNITAGDYIEFTNVKLEIGDTATPFEVEPYAEVLRKCGLPFNNDLGYINRNLQYLYVGNDNVPDLTTFSSWSYVYGSAVDVNLSSTLPLGTYNIRIFGSLTGISMLPYQAFGVQLSFDGGITWIQALSHLRYVPNTTQTWVSPINSETHYGVNITTGIVKVRLMSYGGDYATAYYGVPDTVLYGNNVAHRGSIINFEVLNHGN